MWSAALAAVLICVPALLFAQPRPVAVPRQSSSSDDALWREVRELERDPPTTQPFAKGPGSPKPSSERDEERAGGAEPTTQPVAAAGSGPRSPGRRALLAGDWLGLHIFFRPDRARLFMPGRD